MEGGFIRRLEKPRNLECVIKRIMIFKDYEDIERLINREFRSIRHEYDKVLDNALKVITLDKELGYDIFDRYRYVMKLDPMKFRIHIEDSGLPSPYKFMDIYIGNNCMTYSFSILGTGTKTKEEMELGTVKEFSENEINLMFNKLSKIIRL